MQAVEAAFEPHAEVYPARQDEQPARRHGAPRLTVAENAADAHRPVEVQDHEMVANRPV